MHFSSPQLWSLFARGLAAIYGVAFASLLREIAALAGADGISPVARQLARMRVDFPGARRFVYFPTLLWLAHGDRALKGWLWLGLAAAGWMVAGGPYTPVAFAVCWAVYLSYDVAVDLIYPWDCALLEAGALAVFLPGLGAEPAAAIVWAYRWLLFRIVFGFGKFKFLEGGKIHSGYLSGFVISQPLPSPLGLWSRRLPLWAFQLGLAAMFAVEVVAPLLIFVSPTARVIAAAAIVALMIVIQALGNFGFFNVLVALLCLPLLAAGAPAPLSEHPVATAYVVFVAVAGLAHLPFNSWVTRAWPFWPGLMRLPFVRAVVALFRAVAPFRLVHAYGVFGPETPPPVKWVPVIEGSADGETWREYRYRAMPCQEDSTTRFIAPWMPRFDHGLIYEAYGIQLSSFLGSMFHAANPYRFGRSSALERAMQRLLEGRADVRRLFANDPFPEEPPRFVRATCYLLEPEAGGAAGRVWRRTRLHTHVEPTPADPDVLARWPSPPVAFHWDDEVWRRRSRPLREALSRAPASERLARWREDPAAFHELALRLAGALGPHVEGPRGFRFYLFVLSLFQGDPLEVLHAPTAAASRLGDFDLHRGFAVLARLYGPQLQFHARKLRLLELTMPADRARTPPSFVPDFIHCMPALAVLYPRTTDEHVPRFVQGHAGVWRLEEPAHG